MLADVSRETRDRLGRLAALIVAENEQQNLISRATLADFDSRHIDDSLQLLPLVGDGILVDIGSGAGLPGLVLACARSAPTHLVEPRTRRAVFLQTACEELDIADRVTVHQAKIERVVLSDVAAITARAVAKLDDLFGWAEHLSRPETRWVLPKGRSAQSELDAARVTWQGVFELVPSRTDPDAAIVVASQVRRRRVA